MEQQFKKHVLFTEYTDIQDICQPLKLMGIEGFIFMRHFHDGNFIDLSNNITWSEYFLTQYFNDKYPLDSIQNHICLTEGVSLWIANPDNLIWQEGEQHFNYGNGISITIIERNYKDIFCFYSRKDNYVINQFYINNLSVLKKFCHYFIERADSIIKKGSSYRLKNPCYYLKDIFKQENLTTQKNVINFLNKIDYGLPLYLTKEKLSLRELTCIKKCAEGLTAEKIAKELNLSKRTVENHLLNAKNKFKCKKLSELIYIYMSTICKI